MLMTHESQSGDDAEGVVAAEISRFLDLLVDNIDLKAKDAIDFFNALRSFKTFAISVTEAVRVISIVSFSYISSMYAD